MYFITWVYAYRRNYQFPESATAFQKFSESADRTETRELTPDHEAEMSGNAMSTYPGI